MQQSFYVRCHITGKRIAKLSNWEQEEFFIIWLTKVSLVSLIKNTMVSSKTTIKTWPNLSVYHCLHSVKEPLESNVYLYNKSCCKKWYVFIYLNVFDMFRYI